MTSVWVRKKDALNTALICKANSGDDHNCLHLSGEKKKKSNFCFRALEYHKAVLIILREQQKYPNIFVSALELSKRLTKVYRYLNIFLQKVYISWTRFLCVYGVFCILVCLVLLFKLSLHEDFFLKNLPTNNYKDYRNIQCQQCTFWNP